MGRKLKFVVKLGKKWENIMNLSLIDCWSTIQGKTLQRSQQTYAWYFNSLFRNMNLAWRFVTMEDKKVCGSTQRIWLTKTYSGFSFYDYRFLGLPDHEFWRANLRTLFSAVWRKDTILTFFLKPFITGVTKFMRSKLGIKKENLKLLFAAQRFSFTHDNILTRKIRYQTIWPLLSFEFREKRQPPKPIFS